MDHELQCVLRNPSAEAVEKFERRMAAAAASTSSSSSCSPWTVSMTNTLLSAIPKRPQLWNMLARAEMDDHVVFAVQQHMELLTDQVLILHRQQEEPQSVAMVTTVCMWEALERMRSCTTSLQVDPLWMYSHVEPCKLNEMAAIAVDILMSPRRIDSTSIGVHAIDPDTLCNASVSYMSLLLQHDMKGWLLELDDDNTAGLINRLEQDVTRLNTSVVVSSATVGLALSSAGLLCLLRWKLGQDDLHHQQNLNALLDNVCKVAFHSRSNSPSGPQWTYGPMAADVRPCALNLLQIWTLTGETVPDHCWSHFLHDSWTAILDSKGGGGGNCLPTLLFLHTTSRLSTRQALQYVLGRNDLKGSCRTLVSSLMNHCQQKDIGIASSSAALLRVLLRDRQHTITHDELSRCLWESLDVFPIDKLVDGIIKLASSDATSRRPCQPLLLGMLDVLELLVSHPEGNWTSSLLESNTERIESLIEIMSARPGDPNSDLSLSMEEMNEQTPPVNNLSRLDESHISFVDPTPPTTDEASTAPPSCLDDTIRVAAATILVHLADGATLLTESTATVWRARIQSAVVDFLTTILVDGNHKDSANTKRRLYRLQFRLALSSPENEEALISMRVNEELLGRGERDDSVKQLQNCQRQLDEAQALVKQLETERDRCKRAMRLQSTSFERNLQRSKSKATAEASKLVEVHAAERRAAENRANACVKRAKHVEELQREAESRIEKFKSMEEKAKRELTDIEGKLKGTQDEVQQLRTFADEQKRLCFEQAAKLADYKDRLHIANGENKTTGTHLSATQAALTETKSEYRKLEDDLEKTFAQLSLLAQAYQAKEDEVTRIVEQKDSAIQEARRNADSERRRNDDLEATERHLRFENERLTKKLERSKQKLEAERIQRQEESDRRKQRGPVSYINHLHNSTASETSRVPRSGNTSRRERSKGSGKENVYRSSSSSRREDGYSSSSSQRREYR